MVTAATRRREAGQHPPTAAPLVAVVAAIAVTAVFYLSLRVGHWWTRSPAAIPANPVRALLEVTQGRLAWPTASTALVVLLGGIGVLAVAAVTVSRTRDGRGRERDFDRAAPLMATARELSAVTVKEARASATRLRRDLAGQRPGFLDYGLLLGRLAGPSSVPIFMLWEWVGLVIGGPRCGKTSAMVIPMGCQAPGPAVLTSNKADIYDAIRYVRDADFDPHAASYTLGRPRQQRWFTRWWNGITVTAHDPGIRGHLGRWHVRRVIRARRNAVQGRIWVSDLQHIASAEGQQWWWDPFWDIDDLADARELAAIFKGASTESSARVDAYFDGGAQELLALYILAAACGGGDLKHVDGWLTDPKLQLPRNLLIQHGHADAAAKIYAAQDLNKRQQDGLYDMARRFINIMTVPKYACTVLPPRRVQFAGDNTVGNADLHHNLPAFDPQQFAQSTDTLFALSKEGAGAATALTTALADSVFKAATAIAEQHGGRLPTPMVALLDEAANVCKLPELPDWYSHFGSRGIVVVTFLQSLAQASKVWSAEKLDMLKDASNVYYFAGNSNSTPYLESLVRMIGTRDVRRVTRNRNGSGGVGSSSISESWSSEPILDVAELGAMPDTRAVVKTSGNRVLLLKKNSYWKGPFRHACQASESAAKAQRIAAGLPLDGQGAAA